MVRPAPPTKKKQLFDPGGRAGNAVVYRLSAIAFHRNVDPGQRRVRDKPLFIDIFSSYHVEPTRTYYRGAELSHCESLFYVG